MANEFPEWETQHDGDTVPVLSKIEEGSRRVCIVQTGEKEGEIIAESETGFFRFMEKSSLMTNPTFLESCRS